MKTHNRNNAPRCPAPFLYIYALSFFAEREWRILRGPILSNAFKPLQASPKEMNQLNCSVSEQLLNAVMNL